MAVNLFSTATHSALWSRIAVLIASTLMAATALSGIRHAIKTSNAIFELVKDRDPVALRPKKRCVKYTTVNEDLLLFKVYSYFERQFSRTP